MKADFVPLKTYLEAAFNRIDELHKGDKDLRGVPSGFPDLDNVLAGFQKSDLIILAGTVALDPSLKGKVAPTDTVFVIARAPDGSSPPLAVKRYRVDELPVIFSLADGDAMMPERNLSRFGEAQITARISKTGDAMPQPSDIRSKPVSAKVGATNVKLELR